MFDTTGVEHLPIQTLTDIEFISWVSKLETRAEILNVKPGQRFVSPRIVENKKDVKNIGFKIQHIIHTVLNNAIFIIGIVYTHFKKNPLHILLIRPIAHHFVLYAFPTYISGKLDYS